MDGAKQKAQHEALERLHKDARDLAAVCPGKGNDYKEFVARIDADYDLLNAAIIIGARDSTFLEKAEARHGYKCANNIPAVCQAIGYPCNTCNDWKPQDEVGTPATADDTEA